MPCVQVPHPTAPAGKPWTQLCGLGQLVHTAHQPDCVLHAQRGLLAARVGQCGPQNPAPWGRPGFWCGRVCHFPERLWRLACAGGWAGGRDHKPQRLPHAGACAVVCCAQHVVLCRAVLCRAVWCGVVWVSEQAEAGRPARVPACMHLSWCKCGCAAAAAAAGVCRFWAMVRARAPPSSATGWV